MAVAIPGAATHMPPTPIAYDESPEPRADAADFGTMALGSYTAIPSKASLMIGFIVFGLVVGAIARLVLPGEQHLSIVATLLIGVVGSVIGGVIANLLGTGNIFELNLLGSIVAIIVAALLIVAIDRASAGRR